MDAIARTVDQAEQDAAFEELAAERRTRLQAGGRSVAWDDARPWLKARARGERPRKPAASKPGPLSLRLPLVELSAEFLDDFDRFLEHLALFDVAADPGEQADCSDAEPEARRPSRGE